MEINNPFVPIESLRKRIGAKETHDSFLIEIDPLSEVKIELERGFLEVERDEIVSYGNFLTYKGKILAILYIYDYRASVEDLLSDDINKKAPKFHFSWCRTLQEMERKGKFARYIFSRRKINKFKVQATEWDGDLIKQYGEHHEVEDVMLFACRNCLDGTGYRGYRKDKSKNEKDNAVESFKIIEFLEENEATFTTAKFYQVRHSDETVQPMVYSDDFPEISRKLREEKDWFCTKCKVDMRRMKKGLHTHHKNGVKNDNSRRNLQVLCALCHQNIDSDHKGMHLSKEVTKYIERHRSS